jgi:GNAT superfamily N-acetyltransferase
MATPPEHRRKGMGRALLSQVIEDYRRRGVERFYLGASEAGRPLYASLGFELVAELSVWVLGPAAEIRFSQPLVPALGTQAGTQN